MGHGATLILAGLLIVLAACSQPVTCNPPYLLVGTSCCMDHDGNAICDDDEAAPAQATAPPETAAVPPAGPAAPVQAPPENSAPAPGELSSDLRVYAHDAAGRAGPCGAPEARELAYEKYYVGPLIDTHLHMPVASPVISASAEESGFEDMPHRGDIPLEHIACLLKNEGTTKAFGFFMMPNVVLDSSINALKQDLKGHEAAFAPFFMPPLPLTNLLPDEASTERALNANPGLFVGIGEIRLDFSGSQNMKPEDDYLLDLYGLADAHDLIVQIHPDRGQVAALERLLTKYPDVLFLVHLMVQDHDEVGRLMDAYPNIYYSLDAEISYIYGYQTIQDNRGPTKAEYLRDLRTNFDAWLQGGLTRWQPLIEAHPDRFTWGTDRWFSWHFDAEASALMVEFARTFIGHLDPVVQEKVAYRNAEALLKKR